MAWGWRLPRRRACRYRWAAHGEAWRLLSAKMPRAVRARVLAAQPILDHGAVAGLGGDRGGANLGSGLGEVTGPVQDRADLGQDLGQVDLADATQRLEDGGLGMLAQGGGQGPSRSARLPSRLGSSRTWMRMGVDPGPRDRAGRLRPGRPAAGEAAGLGCAGRWSRGGPGSRPGGPRPAAGRPAGVR